MNWFVFILIAWVCFGLELALLPVFDAGSGGVHPSMVVPLLVFIAINAPRRPTLWCAITLGIVMDLLRPIPAVDGGTFTVIGPHALGYLLGVHFVLAVRGMLISRNPLTMVVMSILVMLIAQIVVVSMFTARGIGDSSLIWDAGIQLRQGLFSSLYTGISALLLSFVFFALGPFFGFASAVPTRFARHI
jgi:rod shape-determining protein MreD